MSTHRKTTKRPPYGWERVLHYANASPTPKNWVSVLLRTRGGMASRRTYEFGSVDELLPVLERFRSVLSTLVAASPDEAAGSMILDVINERAQGTLDGWTWYGGTGRVFPKIRPKDDSFEQSLYAQLAVAMTAESFTSIKQCKVCQRFFYQPRRRAAALCSAKCRAGDAKSRAAHYREEHRDEYRAYQRRLMAKRRREGSA
jgi:hypothetical protein